MTNVTGCASGRPIRFGGFQWLLNLNKNKYFCKTCRLKIVVMLIGIDAHTVVESLGQCFPKSGPRTIFGPQDFQFWSARKNRFYRN
jgi:hypothetical protein